MTSFKSFIKRNIIPIIWLTVGYIWSICYQIVYGQIMLDSDMSSEMVLSKILNDEHSISGITTSWFYSTELRFFNMQWIYRIGLAIFLHNWHMARTFNMSIAIAILAFVVWLVFYAIDCSQLGIWAAAMSIFPGGIWYFWMVIYAGHYIPYILITLFSTALILMASNDIKKVKSRMYIGIICLLGIGSGLNGIRQLMVFYTPLILSSLILLVINQRHIENNDLGRGGCLKKKTGLYFSLILGGMFFIANRVFDKFAFACENFSF